jgi:hypothetical protein
MSFHSAIAFVVACSLGLGCSATVHPIHESPTPAEIAEINALAPVDVDVLPNAAWGGPPLRIDHIVAADAAKILVTSEDGRPFALRVGDVTGFHVRGTGHAAGVGAEIGGVVGALGGCMAVLMLSSMGDSAAAPPGTSRPASPSREPGLAEACLLGAGLGALFYGGVGALIGAAAGSPEVYPVAWAAPRLPTYWPPPSPSSMAPAPSLSAPEPPPSPPLPPPPPVLRVAAIVVAASAEVRSAPFKVAPVVVTLPRGEHLFVDETATAGWRVAYLSDGRVGYVEDSLVKTGSP